MYQGAPGPVGGGVGQWQGSGGAASLPVVGFGPGPVQAVPAGFNYAMPPPGPAGGFPGFPAVAPAAGGWQGGQPAMTSQRIKFFSSLNQSLVADYTIVMDRSGSMAGGRWQQAFKALEALAPAVCRADPDGAAVFFFSSAGKHTVHNNIKSPQDVQRLFKHEAPGGTTDLGGVLTMALNAHFNPGRIKEGYAPGHAPSRIFVITDGEPDDQGEVIRVLVQAANAITADEELSVTFVQGAAKFLRTLDDGLTSKGARFDMVDTVTADKMKGMTFAEFVYKGLAD